MRKVILKFSTLAILITTCFSLFACTAKEVPDLEYYRVMPGTGNIVEIKVLTDYIAPDPTNFILYNIKNFSVRWELVDGTISMANPTYVPLTSDKEWVRKGDFFYVTINLPSKYSFKDLKELHVYYHVSVIADLIYTVTIHK